MSDCFRQLRPGAAPIFLPVLVFLAVLSIWTAPSLAYVPPPDRAPAEPAALPTGLTDPLEVTEGEEPRDAGSLVCGRSEGISREDEESVFEMLLEALMATLLRPR